jgi:hypothetical protein
MPRKLRANKSKKRALTLDEEMALAFGAPSDVFLTYAEARAMYFQNVERMRAYWRAGHRPVAWWAFEANERQPRDSAAGAARLAQLGELSNAEVAEIRAASALLASP